MSTRPRAWLTQVIERLSSEPAVVRVVVAQVQGSTPREPGAFMLVDASAVTGTIGGGRLEWEALAAARDMLKRGTRAVQLMNRVLGIDLGQCCGGVAAVWLECFPAAMTPALAALATQAAQQPTLLTTTLAAEQIRQHPDGNAGTPRSAAPQLQRTGEGRVAFRERLDESYPLVNLYGAGHVGRALAAMLVQLPLELHWFDSRAGQFPPSSGDYARVLTETELIATVRQAAPTTHIIVMTHDHGLDYELCRAAIVQGECRWLGLIGSHSKGARFRSRLRRDGFSPAAIEQLTCPIGVAGIKSKWPAAIAIAIAAQLMQIVSEPLAPAAQSPPRSGDPCPVGDCKSCGRQQHAAEGILVSET